MTNHPRSQPESQPRTTVQDQDVEALRTILHFYKADAKHQQGDTAQMLQLRQAQLGLEALARIEARLSRV